MGVRSIVNSVIFIILICLGFWYLDQVFASTHKLNNTAEAFESVSKNSEIDLLFIGSSHVFTSTIPAVVDKQTKSRSFSFGSDGLRLELSSVILEEALRSCKPKLVAVEIFRGSVAKIETDVSKGFQLRALDFASHTSLQKLKRIREIYENEEILGVYSTLIRNHSKWPEAKFRNLDRKDFVDPIANVFNKGYFGSFRELTDSTRERYKNFRSTVPETYETASYLSPIHIDEMQRLDGLAKEHGFDLLFYTAPDLRYPWINGQLYQEFDSLVGSYGYQYLNLNEYYKELDLKLSDFKDASHLNYGGAVKTSDLLGRIIAERYNLPDRTSEPIWQAEQLNYNRKQTLLLEGELIYKDSAAVSFTPELGYKKLKIRRKLNALQLQLELMPEHLELNGKYILSIQVYPKAGKEDQLSSISKEKGRSFDNYTFRLEYLEEGIDELMRTGIKDIERFRIFIYDSDGYKGVVGNAIIIDDLNTDSNDQ